MALPTINSAKVEQLREELTSPTLSEGWRYWDIPDVQRVYEGHQKLGPGSGKSNIKTSHGVKRVGRALAGGEAKRAREAMEEELLAEQEVGEPEVQQGAEPEVQQEAELEDYSPGAEGSGAAQPRAPIAASLEVCLRPAHKRGAGAAVPQAGVAADPEDHQGPIPTLGQTADHHVYKDRRGIVQNGCNCSPSPGSRCELDYG